MGKSELGGVGDHNYHPELGELPMPLRQDGDGCPVWQKIHPEDSMLRSEKKAHNQKQGCINHQHIIWAQLICKKTQAKDGQLKGAVNTQFKGQTW